MKSAYELSKPGSIAREVQDDLLRRFGDGQPFRWMDVRDAYKRAWKKIKGKGVKDIPFEPSIAISKLMDRARWIVQHQDSNPRIGSDGHEYYCLGIWRSIVPERQVQECKWLSENGHIKDTGTVYYYDEPGCPKCAFCKKIHTNPYNIRRIGRYEVF